MDPHNVKLLKAMVAQAMSDADAAITDAQTAINRAHDSLQNAERVRARVHGLQQFVNDLSEK